MSHAVLEVPLKDVAAFGVGKRPSTVELALVERRGRDEWARKLFTQRATDQFALALQVVANPRADALALVELAAAHHPALFVHMVSCHD